VNHVMHTLHFIFMSAMIEEHQECHACCLPIYTSIIMSICEQQKDDELAIIVLDLPNEDGHSHHEIQIFLTCRVFTLLSISDFVINMLFFS
jgi:hypothetical protein